MSGCYAETFISGEKYMQKSVSGIAAAVLDYINGWPDKPAPAFLAEFGAELPALRLLPLPGITELRRYADGTALIGWPFSVSIRARPSSAASGAVKTLSDLAGYICRAELPSLGGSRGALAVEMYGAPERTASNVSGLVEFTANFRLIYADLPRYD